MFAVAFGLSEDWLSDKISHHLSALRILNYFPLKLNITLYDSVRASHTDYGALTILRNRGPGLQLQKGAIGSDVWIDVPDLSDVFIINIEDMMQRWTSGKIFDWVRKTIYVVFVLIDLPCFGRRQVDLNFAPCRSAYSEYN
jgi:isopenicillin N synthase-like dioxygenase